MSTLLGFYSPNEGVSVEEAFQSHLKAFASQTARGPQGPTIPGLRKYTVGRVTQLDKGERIFTNYFHMTWDDEALMMNYLTAIKACMSLPGLDVKNQFSISHLYTGQETLVFENSTTADKKAVLTRFNVCSPREGISPEAIYKFWVEVHAPHIMDTIARVATPGLQRYVIGWVVEAAVGKPLFRDYVKMWWDDQGAMQRYLEELKVVKLPDGSLQSGPQGELGKQVTWHMNSFVDEEVIFKKSG